MKRRKLRERLLSYLLCLAMVIALVPMNALTVRAEGVEHPCQHCGGTGKVCSDHKDQTHEGESYENEPECNNPCVILEEDNYYCNTHEIYNHGQCEYCTGTGTDPNWTHTHHFVYVHKVDFSGKDYHLSECDYPDCSKGGDLPYSGYNCDTDGPDGACSVCGYKVHEHDYNAYWYNDNWHWKMCIVCSKGQQGSEEIHSYSNWNDGVRSCICGKTETCTHNGATTGTCSTCGKDLGSAHTHSQGTHHAKVDATCVATGTVEYWDCRLCDAKIDVNEKVIEDITIPREKVISSAIDTNSNGFKGEGCENLLDSNTDTKWCCSFDGETFVVIKASEPVIISNYTITTAGDTSQYKDRNPKSWSLLACNDYNEAEKKGTWEEIDSISNGDMPNENTTAKTFNISSTKKYQYYKWNVTSIVGGPILQVSEFELHALHSFENNDANTHKCSFCNTTGEHDFSDQGDGTHKCADCGATGTHDFSKYVSNEDGTHKVVCKDCDIVQEGHDKDACSGGTATCTQKAKCENCGEDYGPLAEHTGGKATCKEKAKCTVCGKEYGSLASHKYATTWTFDGTNHWHACTVCGEKKDNAAHTVKTTTTKATLTENGKKETKCSVCSKVTKTTKIYAAKTIELSKTVYAYDGKAKKPTVIVKDSKGNAIATANYSVKYDDGRKNVGKYNAKITLKGDYKGSKTLSFTINPKETTLKSVTPDSRAFTAVWSKQTTQVGGYEIQYALDKNFTSSVKKVSVTKNTTTSKKISSLQSKKTYYVRVRTYKKVGTKKYYSDWSKVLSVKTK